MSTLKLFFSTPLKPIDSISCRISSPASLSAGEAAVRNPVLLLFINAEILLKRNYPIVLRQVEDKKCYEEVGALIGKLSNGGCSPDEYGRTKAELDFLQDRRTAVMLQKIPEIIAREYAAGRVKTPKAIFTIGLSHIPAILKLLSEGRIRLFPPISSSGPQKNSFQELALQQQNFRVSVLIPKSLTEQPSFLEFDRLGKVLDEKFPPFKISNPYPNTLSP